MCVCMSKGFSNWAWKGEVSCSFVPLLAGVTRQGEQKVPKIGQEVFVWAGVVQA